MPRLRVHIPVSVDVGPETVDAVGKVGEFVRRARESGVGELLADAVKASAGAVRASARRRRRR